MQWHWDKTRCFLLSTMKILDYTLRPPDTSSGDLHWALLNTVKSLPLDLTAVYDHRPISRDLDFSAINKSHCDLVIFPQAHHPRNLHNADDCIEDYLRALNKPYLILSSEDSRTGIYCPWWLITYPKEYPAVTLPGEARAENHTRRFSVSCINNVPRLERLVNMTYFLHQGVSNQHLLTMGEFGYYAENADLLVQAILKNRPHMLEAAQSLISSLPLSNGIVPAVQDFWGDLLAVSENPAYTDTYISVVTEHSFSGVVGKTPPFVSEKSIKPILSGQMFFTVAEPGTLDLLRKHGFDVYDDIMNHSVYEHLPCFYSRLDNMHSRLRQVLRYDWEEIFRLTATRRLRNYQQLQSGDIERDFCNRLMQRIKKLLN